MNISLSTPNQSLYQKEKKNFLRCVSLTVVIHFPAGAFSFLFLLKNYSHIFHLIALLGGVLIFHNDEACLVASYFLSMPASSTAEKSS